MPTYFITSPHTVEECNATGQEFAKHPRAKEILSNTVWRCPFGEHIGYTFADFENENEAKSVVALPALQNKLIIKEVAVFDYDEMMKAHQ